jgi:3-hydroxyisobutyrate dehydrogenase-like beta-hydroxyacid dehydrogenase
MSERAGARPKAPGASSVGLIGIGLMGEVFARRLIDARWSVRGFDTDPARRARLEEMGGSAACSVAELASCSIVILAVFSTEQVEDVIEQLVKVSADSTERIVLCTSTCDPLRIAALAARLEGRSLKFLEVPISGTSEQVRRGEGVGLIGGEPELAARVTSVLDVLVPSRFHIGAVGDGGRAKLAVNLILGLNRLALAEGLVFAQRLGLDPQKLLAVARGSAAYSQVMDTKGAKMVDRDFAPEGRVRQTLKDVHLMLDQARRYGQALPLLAVHEDVLAACVEHGEGERDNSIVIEEIRRRG